MFKLLGKVFGGNPVEKIVGIADKFTWTKEEKAEFKAQLEQQIHEAEMEMQREVTKRWQYDTQSDSWLSKNIRPLVLAFLIIATVLLIFIDAGVIAFEVQDHWVDLLQLVLITVITAYFGGRSTEKVFKNRSNKE